MAKFELQNDVQPMFEKKHNVSFASLEQQRTWQISKNRSSIKAWIQRMDRTNGQFKRRNLKRYAFTLIFLQD